MKKFKVKGKLLPVRYIETQKVKDGVECDIYEFVDDKSKDLGVIRVLKGHKTPLQKVVSGDETREGFMNGEGTLTVKSVHGETKTYKFRDGDKKQGISVSIGEVMQWYADGSGNLEFYEICEPPYKDGRFQNLSE